MTSNTSLASTINDVGSSISSTITGFTATAATITTDINSAVGQLSQTLSTTLSAGN